MRYFVSIRLDGEEKVGCFTFLSFWCPVIVVWLFLAMPLFCLQFVIVVIPDHARLLFFYKEQSAMYKYISQHAMLLR